MNIKHLAALVRTSILLALMLIGHHANAQPVNCNWAVTFSPAFPSSIQGTQTVGNVIYNGTVRYDATCNATPPGTSSGNFILRLGWGTVPSPIVGVSGLTAENSSTAFPTGYGCISGPFTLSSFDTDIPGSISFTGCTFTTTIGLLVRASATTVSGAFPPANSLNQSLVSGSTKRLSSTCGWGWATISNGNLNCTSFSINGWNNPVILSNTCTVSASSIAVNLPTVGTGALSAPGSTAGATAFGITLSGCNSSASGFIGTQTWSFAPGPSASVIANSAASPAANVYTQILDSNATPIANGGTVSFSVPAAGGSVTRQFYARYYSAGSAGTGAVKGVATFDMTYN